MKNRIALTLLGLGLLASGCGFHEVRFNITEAPKVKLPGIRTIAILGFADPYHRQAYGSGFAAQLAKSFQDHATFALVPPAEAEQALASLRLQPSEFTGSVVIREVGRRLGADAVFYGDVLEASLTPGAETTTVSKQVGERQVVREETLPSGEIRKVSQAVPVYRDFWRRRVIRSGRFRAAARLVRAADNAVLWEGQVDRARRTENQETEEGERSGDWSTDQAFMERLIRRAASRLARDLFPHVQSRTRRLAETGDGSAYAALVAQGNALALADEWNQAGSVWLRATALDAARPEARANLGVLRERAGDFGQAASDYAAAAAALGSPWHEYAAEVERAQEQP